MRTILIVLVVLLTFQAFGQRKGKEEDTTVPVYNEGIVYALSRTGFKIYVKALKETFTPGPYAAYAEQLLGITGVETKAYTRWTIADVNIETFSEPDPGQVYKAIGKGANSVSLTANGCLAGIGAPNAAASDMQVVTNRFVAEPEQDDGFAFSSFNDTPFYLPGDSTNGFRPMRAGMEQKAAEAATRILESRMNRYDMAAGLLDEFPPDGKGYEVSLKELKETEKNYLTLFAGRKTYRTQVFSFDFVPSSSPEKGEVLFRFTDEKGVVPATDLSGKPVMIELDAEKNLTDRYAGLAASQNPAAGESGVYYRMPAVADVKIILELKTIATARVVVAQLGVVAPVPEELLYGEYSIEFHPETGAIKSIAKK